MRENSNKNDFVSCILVALHYIALYYCITARTVVIGLDNTKPKSPLVTQSVKNRIKNTTGDPD